MNIRSTFQTILLSLFAFALSDFQVCAQPCKVVGHIQGLGNRAVMFGYTQKGIYKIDTVSTTNDRFTYEPKPSDDGRIQIRISRPRYTSFWYEPGSVIITGSVDKPYRLTFKGGPENTVLNQYQQLVQWPYESKKQLAPDSLKASLDEEERQATIAFIRQYPSTRTSAYLLYWETILHEHFIDTYEAIFTLLTPQSKASYQGKEVAQRIRVLRNQPVVGKVAPNFTLADTAGRAISLSTYRGKYVLLDFWGHWCSPCIKSFPKLKSLQKTYGDKLVIVGVAAEYATDKPQWIRTIKTHELSWLQVSELMSDKGHVNMEYNITAFPTYLLLDKEGTVLERSLGLDAIEQKLTKIDE